MYEEICGKEKRRQCVFFSIHLFLYLENVILKKCNNMDFQETSIRKKGGIYIVVLI